MTIPTPSGGAAPAGERLRWSICALLFFPLAVLLLVHLLVPRFGRAGPAAA